MKNIFRYCLLILLSLEIYADINSADQCIQNLNDNNFENDADYNRRYNREKQDLEKSLIYRKHYLDGKPDPNREWSKFDSMNVNKKMRELDEAKNNRELRQAADNLNAQASRQPIDPLALQRAQSRYNSMLQKRGLLNLGGGDIPSAISDFKQIAAYARSNPVGTNDTSTGDMVLEIAAKMKRNPRLSKEATEMYEEAGEAYYAYFRKRASDPNRVRTPNGELGNNELMMVDSLLRGQKPQRAFLSILNVTRSIDNLPEDQVYKKIRQLRDRALETTNNSDVDIAAYKWFANVADEYLNATAANRTAIHERLNAAYGGIND